LPGPNGGLLFVRKSITARIPKPQENMPAEEKGKKK
jgi:hypothetical protein